MRSATITTLPLGSILGTTALAALVIAANAAQAQQVTTGDLVVTADVAEGCTVTSGTLQFGTYEPDTDLDEQGSFQLNCAANGQVLIELGPGGRGNFDGLRRMTSNGNPLEYQLFQDALGTQWGEGAAAKPHPVNEGTQIVTVFGRIPSQPAVPGTYQDTVLITVTPD